MCLDTSPEPHRSRGKIYPRGWGFYLEVELVDGMMERYQKKIWPLVLPQEGGVKQVPSSVPGLWGP